MSNVYDTNSGPILEAISSKRTILVFQFSNLDSEFFDIHTYLPSLEEASAINNLSRLQPTWEWDLELAIVNKYTLIPLERDWLLTEAPAGLATSLSKALLECAYPTDPDEVQALINITRDNQLLYDQIKSLATMSNMTYQDVSNLDIFELLKVAIYSEASLIREGVLENGLTITSKPVKNTTGSHMKGYGVIDTKSANAQLAKA